MEHATDRVAVRAPYTSCLHAYTLYTRGTKRSLYTRFVLGRTVKMQSRLARRRIHQLYTCTRDRDGGLGRGRGAGGRFLALPLRYQLASILSTKRNFLGAWCNLTSRFSLTSMPRAPFSLIHPAFRSLPSPVSLSFVPIAFDPTILPHAKSFLFALRAIQRDSTQFNDSAGASCNTGRYNQSSRIIARSGALKYFSVKCCNLHEPPGCPSVIISYLRSHLARLHTCRNTNPLFTEGKSCGVSAAEILRNKFHRKNPFNISW